MAAQEQVTRAGDLAEQIQDQIEAIEGGSVQSPSQADLQQVCQHLEAAAKLLGVEDQTESG